MSVHIAHNDKPLVDGFARQITYLRISVTDRCDFRCTYCMGEDMQFLKRSQVLSYEEIVSIADLFIARGVTKIRLTGGEPLVRKDIMQLVRTLGAKLGNGLNELTLTTNGSQLTKYAADLFEAGVRRVNVSLDTRDPALFKSITRRGDFEQVMAGIAEAQRVGLKVKINMVALKGINDQEIDAMIAWAHGEGCDLTLIEGMPLGDVSLDRADSYLPLKEVYASLAERFSLAPLTEKSGGPARYWRVEETGGKLGFITPMSHNFCESCNRVRLSAKGELFLCLGQEDKVNLRDALRQGGHAALNAALDHAMVIKPKGHDFDVTRAKPAVARHMSATGG